MDSVTRHMIETIDRRLAKLQQIRGLIIEEFGEAGNEPTIPVQRQQFRKPSGVGQRNGTPRKIVMHDWLKKNGPATRGEIIAGTSFPEGTVGSLLSQCPNLFESHDGKWQARP